MSEDEKKAVLQTITLNKGDMHSAATERVMEIAKEFTEGFKFLKDYPKSVTFFGSTVVREGDAYYDKARALSARIAKELGFSVVSGGGPGIMEAADRGAYEAGGNSIGLLIKLPDAQPTNQYIKKSVSFYYFFARKVCLAFGADVFIFFPGGFGTLDEFFEIITLFQTKKVVGAPIICYGSEYWNKLKTFMTEELLSRGMIDPGDTELFKICDSEDEIIEIMRQAKIVSDLPFKKIEETATVAS